MTRIRLAVAEDLPALQGIERAAGQRFRDVGMAEVADDEPPTLDALDRHRHDGRAWVAVDAAGRAVAYLIADIVDGCVHVEQVSVRPDSAGRGVGRALVEHVASWAASAHAPALTLTTLAQVPWNAPYYARLGFRALAEGELTPGLRAIVRREAEHGLNRWPRVCMRRDL